MKTAMKTAMKTERSSYWDNGKYILMILVVIGHVVEPLAHETVIPRSLFDFIYTFHMPVFIFISGMFSKSVIDGTRFRAERILTYLILYFAYIAARYAVCSALLIPVEFNPFIEGGLGWYMLCMAIWIGATYLLREMRPWILLPLTILLAYGIGFQTEIGDILALNRVVNYWPLFLIGYYIKPGSAEKFLCRIWFRLFSLCVIIALIWLIKNYFVEYNTIVRLFTGRNDYATIAEDCDYFQPWMRLAYYPFIVLVGSAVLGLIPRARIPLVSVWGGRTLQIYFLHRLFLYVITAHGFFDWINATWHTEMEHAVVSVIFGILITILFSFKIWSFPFTWIMGRKYSFLLGRRTDAASERRARRRTRTRKRRHGKGAEEQGIPENGRYEDLKNESAVGSEVVGTAVITVPFASGEAEDQVNNSPDDEENAEKDEKSGDARDRVVQFHDAGSGEALSDFDGKGENQNDGQHIEEGDEHGVSGFGEPEKNRV